MIDGDKKHAKKTYHNGTANHFISIGKEIVLKKKKIHTIFTVKTIDRSSSERTF